MTTTLVLPGTVVHELTAAANRHDETAGVLLAGFVQSPNGDLRLVARKLFWVDEQSYLERGPDGLSIASTGYVQALGEAESLHAIPIWIHTHPTESGVPTPSARDHKVDSQIADLFRLRAGSPYYGAAIFSPRPAGLVFTGHLDEFEKRAIPIDRLWIAGERFRLTNAWNSNLGTIPPIFDRNIRAFGPEIQRTLAGLHFGIVGCGGSGSAIAEQLVRLGVRTFTLIDPDRLSASNVTRLYGSTLLQVGEPKVQVVEANLRRIAPTLVCNSVQSGITAEHAARQLVDCDIIFGCTDDNAGRLILSRLSTYYLTPVIDCGVLLSSNERGTMTGIHGRITTLVPGSACLVCRDRIDLARASAELKTADERARLADEGYAPALGRTEPAVVTFTTLVAATAVSELLERLIGYGPTPSPTEILLRCHEREISSNIALPRPGHYCDPNANKMGAGDTAPFLDQLWPS